MGVIINQMDIVPATSSAGQPSTTSVSTAAEQTRPPARPPFDRELRRQHERSARVRVY
jgi:hypothetical protein